MSNSHHFHDISITGGNIHFGNFFGDRQSGGDATGSRVNERSKNEEEQRRRALLAWLSFPRMHTRRETIKIAHQNTFQWILKEDKDDAQDPVGFTKWLKQEKSVFWVSGKAGSGKSTVRSLHSYISIRKTDERPPIAYENDSNRQPYSDGPPKMV